MPTGFVDTHTADRNHNDAFPRCDFYQHTSASTLTSNPKLQTRHVHLHATTASIWLRRVPRIHQSISTAQYRRADPWCRTLCRLPGSPIHPYGLEVLGSESKSIPSNGSRAAQPRRSVPGHADITALYSLLSPPSHRLPWLLLSLIVSSSVGYYCAVFGNATLMQCLNCLIQDSGHLAYDVTHVVTMAQSEAWEHSHNRTALNSFCCSTRLEIAGSFHCKTSY